MERKLDFCDTSKIALLINYQATKSRLLSYERIIKFNEVLNKKVSDLKDDFFLLPKDKMIFFEASDELDKKYLVLNPAFQCDDIKLRDLLISVNSDEDIDNIYLNILSDEVLKTINLIEVDGVIVSRSNYYSSLSKKYNLNYDVPKEKFNIFNEWESISDNDCIERFCLGKEEHLILDELRKNKKNQGHVLQKSRF